MLFTLKLLLALYRSWNSVRQAPVNGFWEITIFLLGWTETQEFSGALGCVRTKAQAVILCWIEAAGAGKTILSWVFLILCNPGRCSLSICQVIPYTFCLWNIVRNISCEASPVLALDFSIPKCAFDEIRNIKNWYRVSINPDLSSLIILKQHAQNTLKVSRILTAYTTKLLRRLKTFFEVYYGS